MSEALTAVFSADDAADVHRPSDSPQPRYRQCARSPAPRGRAPPDLHGREHRGRGGGPRPGRAQPVWDRSPTVVASRRRLGWRSSRSSPSRPGPLRDLHRQCARERERACAQNHQDRGHFPTDEAAATHLAGAAEYHGALGRQGQQRLAPRDATVCDPLRGSHREPRVIECTRASTVSESGDARPRPPPLGNRTDRSSHSAHMPSRFHGKTRSTARARIF